jgi:hypothetical protein
VPIEIIMEGHFVQYVPFAAISIGTTRLNLIPVTVPYLTVCLLNHDDVDSTVLLPVFRCIIGFYGFVLPISCGG